MASRRVLLADSALSSGLSRAKIQIVPVELFGKRQLFGLPAQQQQTTAQIFELTLHTHAYGSWIFERSQFVEQNGAFYTLTPVDPIFVLVSLLSRSTQQLFVQPDQLLSAENSHSTQQTDDFASADSASDGIEDGAALLRRALLQSADIHALLGDICDTRTLDPTDIDSNLYRFSIGKTQAWIRQKLLSIVEALDTTSTTESNKEDVLQHSLQRTVNAIVPKAKIRKSSMDTEGTENRKRHITLLSMSLLWRYLTVNPWMDWLAKDQGFGSGWNQAIQELRDMPADAIASAASGFSFAAVAPEPVATEKAKPSTADSASTEGEASIASSISSFQDEGAAVGQKRKRDPVFDEEFDIASQGAAYSGAAAKKPKTPQMSRSAASLQKVDKKAMGLQSITDFFQKKKDQ